MSAPAGPQGAPLPVAPFLALVEEQIAALGSLRAVIARIEGLAADDSERIYRSSLYRKLRDWQGGESTRWRRRTDGTAAYYSWSPRFVTMAVADRIVTRLVGPEAWHTRPDLRALYEQERAA